MGKFSFLRKEEEKVSDKETPVNDKVARSIKWNDKELRCFVNIQVEVLHCFFVGTVWINLYV